MSKFTIGQIVRIRQWDDMANQFGVDSDGDIMAPLGFTKDMEYLCGQRITIKHIDPIDKIIYLDGCDGLYFAEEMFEQPKHGIRSTL